MCKKRNRKEEIVMKERRTIFPMTNKIGFQIGGDYFKNDDENDPSLSHDIFLI